MAARKDLLDNRVKHGCSGESLYHTWLSMRQRCENPKHSAYKRYGGRGITICDRWQVVENFIADMGERPSGHSLDRKDNSKGYSPENCMWSSAKQQSSNRRNNIMVCWDDNVMTLKDAAAFFGICYNTARKRIKCLKWSMSDALTKAA